MVLAAGLGSRLRPLTASMPKPLVPVGDRAALAHVLDRLASAGATRVVVNAHHEVGAMEAFVGVRASQERPMLSVEVELLGTAGGLGRAAPLLGEGPVLVWNADILVDLDVNALVGAHAAGPAREATLVVQMRNAGEGTVGLDRTGRVVRLRRERFGAEADEASGGEFVGIHVIGEGLRAALPERGCLVGDVYLPAMRRGARLESFRCDAPFFDIGSLERYLEANLAWLTLRALASWKGPGAAVAEGVTLDRSVVGEGATVAGQGSLARCVVWPGAAARAPLADAVVIPGAVVRVAHAKGSAPP
jgi:mannose-1-phosphate guanylyltransferase